jgi:hypothetical protein
MGIVFNYFFFGIIGWHIYMFTGLIHKKKKKKKS